MPQNKLSNLSSQKKILLGKEDKELEKFDLIEIQKESWEKFIKIELKEIINEFFPIEDYTKKKFILFFEDIFFGDPRYPLELCVQKKLTYDTPVYLKLRLVNKKTGIERQQEVYFFNLPKMTSRGTFIINGIERAIINQIVRSPGLYFTAEIDKTTGLTLYNAEIRPYIGAWLDITLNKNNLIEMKVNKKRKFLATVLLRAFEGENNNDKILFSKLFTTAGQSLPLELISAEGNETISYGPDFSSTGAYHVQSDFKKGSTYPISVEIMSINSKPVESPIKVLFDFRTA